MSSHFTKEHETFIVKQFHLGFSPTLVKRRFMNAFGYAHIFRSIAPKNFKRIFERFEKQGVAKAKRTISLKEQGYAWIKMEVTSNTFLTKMKNKVDFHKLQSLGEKMSPSWSKSVKK